jgi:hypothetical protein
MVRIREGTPFVAPTQTLFVLTGIEMSFTAIGASGSNLAVNGQAKLY